MNDFFIGNDNFGVEDFTFEVDHEKQIIEKFIINTNKQVFDKMTEDGEWSWALYPPNLYIKNTPYQIIDDKITLVIDDDVLDNYDIAIYIMEHLDIEGTLTINQKNILEFKGTSYINGKEYPLEILLDVA